MAGRIVVGVDDTPGSLAALTWAIEEARLRNAEIEAIGVWEVLTVSVPGVVVPVVTDEGQASDRFATLLAAVDAVNPEASGVTVTPRVEEGSAGAVLVDVADGADLLVVGSRRVGGVRGLIGSVSQYVVRHAPCPVVVVPAHAT